MAGQTVSAAQINLSGEPATTPTAGLNLGVDADGAAVIIDPNGDSSPLGGGGVSDGVSIDGVGSIADPFAIIPSYIQGLVAPTLPKAGSNLTDADATVNPASSAISVSTLPAATLSANRVLTLGVTGSPITNSVYQVIRRDLTNKTYTVKDDAATTLYTFTASPGSPQGATFYFDGTHYALLNFFYVAV